MLCSLAPAAAAHSFSNEMSKDSDGAKQQAQRNRMSSFNIALQSIKVNLPVATKNHFQISF